MENPEDESPALRILLVDDDREDYLITRALLRESRLGLFELAWAETFDRGLAAVKAGRFDAVLVDYNLGLHSGIELILAAKAAGVGAPILLLTGHGSYEVDVEAMRAGAVDYLNKGEINASGLERAIRYAVDRTRIEQEIAAVNNSLAAAYVRINAQHEELSGILESISDGFFSLDRAWRITYINARAARASGRSPAELVGKLFWEGFPSLAASELHRRYHDVMETRQPISLEWQDTGAQRWYQISIYPSPQGISVFWMDRTEQKRAEQDAAFLIALGEVINQASSPEDLLHAVSAKALEYLEIKRCVFAEIDEASGQARLVPPMPAPDQPPIQAAFSLSLYHPEIIARLRAGLPVVNRDAQLDPRSAGGYDLSSRPLGFLSYIAIPITRGGHWTYVVVAGDDRPRNWNDRQVALLQTTAERAWAAYENHRLVAALRENEETALRLAGEAQFNLQKLETVIDSMNESVLFGDLKGNVFRINPAAVALHGYSTEEEMQHDLAYFSEHFEVLSPEGQPIPVEAWPHSRALRGETVINFEMHACRRDTGKRWIGLYSSLPVRNDQGDILLILDTITDITGIREAERTRRDLDSRLQVQHLLVDQREQERLQIARDLHDGPIQDLISLAYTLGSAIALTGEPEARQILQGAREEAQNLVTALRGVTNELRSPVLVKFGLAKAIQAHAEELPNRLASAPQVDLALDEDHDLPADARLALYRIYQESLNNILRHAGATRVSVRLNIDPRQVRLTIRDNGAGFTPPDDWLSLARQGHLGLVGIKERAEAIGARLEITSAPGAGTQIQVTLDLPEG